MALPRPILFAVVGLVLIAGAFFATRSGRESVDTTPVEETAVTPAPAADVPQTPGIDKLDAVAVEPGASAPKAQRDAAKDKAARERKADRSEGGRREAKREARTEPVRERKAKTKAKQAPAALGPVDTLARALRRNAVVVLFFRQRGADDDATASAVNSVRGRRVAVMTLPIGRAPQYSEAFAGITVSRAPSVVVMARRRQPLLVEGFIDSATLRQAVADLR